MRRSVRAALALVLFPAATCRDEPLPPLGQLLVYVDTDAPLALAPGETLSLRTPAPLFDRLRIELLDARGAALCEGCARDFAISRALVADGLSFGARPPEGATGARLRAQLFRGVRAPSGTPPSAVTIDQIVELPKIGAEGIVELTVRLPLESLGIPANLAGEAAPAISGKAVRGELHAGVTPRDCGSAPRDGEACVYGGAFWMSSPLVAISSVLGVAPPERVVIVSPFFLDATEVTVRRFRLSAAVLGEVPQRSEGRGDRCTYTDTEGPFEELPVTCVTSRLAARYCELRGGRLPTEAELEFVSGGRASLRYPWGTEDPACADAIVARIDPATPNLEQLIAATCARLGVGPAPPRSGGRDGVDVGEGRVFDLVGNVSEWALDTFEQLGGKCWPSGLLVDPRCTSGRGFVHRGGSWWSTGPLGRSTARSSSNDALAYIGFRCARDAR